MSRLSTRIIGRLRKAPQVESAYREPYGPGVEVLRIEDMRHSVYVDGRYIGSVSRRNTKEFWRYDLKDDFRLTPRTGIEDKDNPKAPSFKAAVIYLVRVYKGKEPTAKKSKRPSGTSRDAKRMMRGEQRSTQVLGKLREAKKKPKVRVKKISGEAPGNRTFHVFVDGQFVGKVTFSEDTYWLRRGEKGHSAWRTPWSCWYPDGERLYPAESSYSKHSSKKNAVADLVRHHEKWLALSLPKGWEDKTTGSSKDAKRMMRGESLQEASWKNHWKKEKRSLRQISKDWVEKGFLDSSEVLFSRQAIMDLYRRNKKAGLQVLMPSVKDRKMTMDSLVELWWDKARPPVGVLVFGDGTMLVSGALYLMVGIEDLLKRGHPPLPDQIVVKFTFYEGDSVLKGAVPVERPHGTSKQAKRMMRGESLTEATRGPKLRDIASSRASTGEIIVTPGRTYRYPARELYELHRRSQAKHAGVTPKFSPDDMEKAKGRIRDSGWESVGVAEIGVYTDGYMAFNSADAYVDVAMKMGYTGDIKVIFRFARVPSGEGMLANWAVDMTSSEVKKPHGTSKQAKRMMRGESTELTEFTPTPGSLVRNRYKAPWPYQVKQTRRRGDRGDFEVWVQDPNLGQKNIGSYHHVVLPNGNTSWVSVLPLDLERSTTARSRSHISQSDAEGRLLYFYWVWRGKEGKKPTVLPSRSHGTSRDAKRMMRGESLNESGPPLVGPVQLYVLHNPPPMVYVARDKNGRDLVDIEKSSDGKWYVSYFYSFPGWVEAETKFHKKYGHPSFHTEQDAMGAVADLLGLKVWKPPVKKPHGSSRDTKRMMRGESLQEKRIRDVQLPPSLKITTTKKAEKSFEVYVMPPKDFRTTNSPSREYLGFTGYHPGRNHDFGDWFSMAAAWLVPRVGYRRTYHETEKEAQDYLVKTWLLDKEEKGYVPVKKPHGSSRDAKRMMRGESTNEAKVKGPYKLDPDGPERYVVTDMKGFSYVAEMAHDLTGEWYFDYFYKDSFPGTEEDKRALSQQRFKTTEDAIQAFNAYMKYGPKPHGTSKQTKRMMRGESKAVIPDGLQVLLNPHVSDSNQFLVHHERYGVVAAALYRDGKLWQVDSLVRGLRFHEDGMLVKILEKFLPLLEDFMSSNRKPHGTSKQTKRMMRGESRT